MAEHAITGNGRKLVEYRSVITLGNLLSIVTILVTVLGAVTWWYGEVQARLAALEVEMEFSQAALAAMAHKLGVELPELERERPLLRPFR